MAVEAVMARNDLKLSHDLPSRNLAILTTQPYNVFMTVELMFVIHEMILYLISPDLCFFFPPIVNP